MTVMALALGELVKGKDTHKILEEVKRQLTEVSRQVEDLPDSMMCSCVQSDAGLIQRTLSRGS